jgi:ribulose 1,5-bisphosphate carboxylase large subunit-like protein
MANVGGAIHGHPNGSYNGTVAMRAAIDEDFENEQYKLAIDKWGLIN